MGWVEDDYFDRTVSGYMGVDGCKSTPRQKPVLKAMYKTLHLPSFVQIQILASEKLAVTPTSRTTQMAFERWNVKGFLTSSHPKFW
jgi:hypothetical protein